MIPQQPFMVGDGRVFQRYGEVVVIIGDTVFSFSGQVLPFVTVQVDVWEGSGIELVAVFVDPVGYGQEVIVNSAETVLSPAAHAEQEAQLKLFPGQVGKLFGEEVGSSSGGQVGGVFHIVRFRGFEPEVPRG